MEFDVDNAQIETTQATPAGKETKDETVTISKAEVEALRRDRDEARDSERYWAGVARSGGGGRPAAITAEEVDEELDPTPFLDEKAPDGIEGDTPEKLVDDVASKGVAALKTRGFVTAAEAQRIAVEAGTKVARELIKQERGKISSDAVISNQFPELRDPNSELFKKTAEFYQDAIAMDPNARKTPAALFLAAKAAKASLGTKEPPARQTRRDDDEGDRYEREPEEDRRARADAQDGRTRGRVPSDDRDDMLGDEAKQIIRSMGITEEEFLASKKQTASSYRPRGGRR